MTWTDNKITGNTLTATEYNDAVNAIRHYLVQDANWSTFDSDQSPAFLFNRSSGEIASIDQYNFTIGKRDYSTANDVTILIASASGYDSILKLREGSDNYGFTIMYDGSSTNNLHILSHSNDASGKKRLEIERDASNIYFYDTAEYNAFKFNYAENLSMIEGGTTTGDDFAIKANSSDSYPYLKLNGSSTIQLLSHSDIIFYEQAVQMFKFSLSDDTSIIEGGSDTGKDFEIKANTTDSYPRLILQGNSGPYWNLPIAGSMAWYARNAADTANLLKFRIKSSDDTTTSIYGGGVTGDDLVILANDTDSYPKIRLNGNSGIDCTVSANGNYIINAGATQMFQMYVSGDQSILRGTSARPNMRMAMDGTYMGFDTTDNYPIVFWSNSGTFMSIAKIADTTTEIYTPANFNLKLTAGSGGYVILSSIKSTTGDPASPVEGMIYINTFDNKIKMYAEGAWRQLATW